MGDYPCVTVCAWPSMGVLELLLDRDCGSLLAGDLYFQTRSVSDCVTVEAGRLTQFTSLPWVSTACVEVDIEM